VNGRETSHPSQETTIRATDSMPPEISSPFDEDFHWPVEPMDNEEVEIRAYAYDPTGIKYVKIFVDGNEAKSCTTGDCEHKVSPKPARTKVKYLIKAEDGAGNVKQTSEYTIEFVSSDKTPPVINVSITPEKPVDTDAITFRITARDPESGIGYIRALLTEPSFESIYVETLPASETITASIGPLAAGRYKYKVEAMNKAYPLIKEYDQAIKTGAFTVGSRPTVTGTEPAHQATGLSADKITEIKVSFSKPMDRAETQKAVNLFRQVTGGLELNAPTDIGWEDSDRTMVFKPSKPIEGDNTYVIKVLKGAKDIEGYIMAQDQDYTFSVVRSDVVAPSLDGGFLPNLPPNYPVTGKSQIILWATAEDPAPESGLKEVSIILPAVNFKKTCTSSPCYTIQGPFGTGSIEYMFNAEDKAGNQANLPQRSFSISPSIPGSVVLKITDTKVVGNDLLITWYADINDPSYQDIDSYVIAGTEKGPVKIQGKEKTAAVLEDAIQPGVTYGIQVRAVDLYDGTITHERENKAFDSDVVTVRK
jgi:hypothetical protein